MTPERKTPDLRPLVGRADHPRDWSLFDLEVPAAGRIEYPLHIGVWDAPKPTRLAMDVHQGMEIGFVLRGRMERHYEDLVFVAGPGDIHLRSAWEPHGWRVVDPNTLSIVFIFLPEVMDTDLLRDVPWLGFFTAPPDARPRTRSRGMRESILAVGEIIRREADEGAGGWTGIRLLLYYLLLLIDRFWVRPGPAVSQTHVSSSGFARVLPAVALVHGNPAADVSLAEAASACGLRRSRFSTIFQQTMGVTFGHFRTRARLARVAYELLTTDSSTDAIAEQTGFVDGSHLHRTFVRYYGRTPGEYRSLHRG